MFVLGRVWRSFSGGGPDFFISHVGSFGFATRRHKSPGRPQATQEGFKFGDKENLFGRGKIDVRSAASKHFAIASNNPGPAGVAFGILGTRGLATIPKKAADLRTD